MSKQFYVYIMGNARPILYIGVTNNLKRRVYEHKEGLIQGFTKKYDLNKLLYFELHQDTKEAILREKRLKHWNRKWKLRIIKEMNPSFNDLYAEIV